MAKAVEMVMVIAWYSGGGCDNDDRNNNININKKC